MQEHDISELVRTSIETKILKAFRDTPDMIDELVKAAITGEVNEHGGKPSYNDKRTMPYLTYLAESTIRGIAANAVREYFASNADAIKAKVQQHMEGDQFAIAVGESIAAIASQEWRFDVDFKVVRTET